MEPRGGPEEDIDNLLAHRKPVPSAGNHAKKPTPPPLPVIREDAYANKPIAEEVQQQYN